MRQFEEHLFGRIAVLKGHLTLEQLQECLEIQRSSAASGSPLRIGQILLAKGYLDERALIEIVDVRRKKLRRMTRSAEDLLRVERAFRRYALEQSVVSASTMEAAVLEHQRLRRLNIQVPIWEVLVSQGAIEAAAVFDVLTRLDRRVLICRACDAYCRVRSYRKGARYRCPTCETILSEAPFLDLVATDDVVGDTDTVAVPGDTPMDREGADYVEIL
jgi:hypothetical protein